MAKKKPDLPPGVLDEIITRLEALEEFKAAVEGSINAAVVVYGVRRLPKPPDEPGDEA